MAEREVSLVAQRFDGIEVRGLPGRINAEHQSYRARNRKRDEDPQERKSGVQKGDGKMQDEREDASGRNADESAYGAQGHSLHRELRKNVFPRGADRFADSDLASALRHR